MNSETHTSSSDVLIVYDSVSSGKRAKELCDRLGQQLAPDCKLNLSVWSLSALELLPPLTRAAAIAAERCRSPSRVASTGAQAQFTLPTARSWRNSTAF